MQREVEAEDQKRRHRPGLRRTLNKISEKCRTLVGRAHLAQRAREQRRGMRYHEAAARGKKELDGEASQTKKRVA